MIKSLKNVDTFTKNIILVFLGTSLVNIFNLLYQLLIAHRLSIIDFAAINSLLSIFMLISAPLVTLQTAVVKYVAEFNAKSQIEKIQVLLSSLMKKILPLAIFTLLTFYLSSSFLMDKLKIPSLVSGYILAVLLASSCIVPLLSGALQGLELFKWLMTVSVISGLAKLLFTFIFINLGFNIAGALSAFLVASLIGIIISFFPLKNFLNPVKNTAFSNKKNNIPNDINFKEFFYYFLPVAISSFCFMLLVSFDMVLVKYFFIPSEAGFYSLAQMVGKIFLFLPGAISTVMFPKTAGLNANQMNTKNTLNRSLLYACGLCVLAILAYNLFPFFILKVLTGKVFAQSIALGRLFSLSMSFFALLYILIVYLLSIKDLGFIKYLILFTLLQFLAILLFHRDLMQVQWILCINSILLFFIHLGLVYRKRGLLPNSFLAYTTQTK